MTPGTRGVAAACVAVVMTWVLVSIGGAANPGYKQYEQYLSALSAEGTQSAGWGRAALLVAAAGIVVLVPVLARWSRPVATWTAAAALGCGAVAAAPMACPAGTRFCHAVAVGSALQASMHATAVIVFAAATAGAIATGMAQALRRGTAPSVAVGAAVATVVVLGSPALLMLSGLPQRWLLLAAQLALVALAQFAVVEGHRVDRRRAAERARFVPLTPR